MEMLNITQLSARIQQSITNQLSNNTEQISQDVHLSTSDTQKLLKKIFIIKQNDKRKKKNRFMAKRELQFEYVTQQKSVNISHSIQKEHMYESKKRMSLAVVPSQGQTYRLQYESRQISNYEELHKLDESIALDILNRQRESTGTNFYDSKRKSIPQRRAQSHQATNRDPLIVKQLFQQYRTPKIKSEECDVQKTVRYVLPISNIGIPIVRNNRNSLVKQINTMNFSMLNDFNYSKLDKSLWIL